MVVQHEIVALISEGLIKLRASGLGMKITGSIYIRKSLTALNEISRLSISVILLPTQNNGYLSFHVSLVPNNNSFVFHEIKNAFLS